MREGRKTDRLKITSYFFFSWKKVGYSLVLEALDSLLNDFQTIVIYYMLF